MIRSGSVLDAIEALPVYVSNFPKALGAEVYVVRAVAEIILRRFDDAHASLTEARAIAFSTDLVPLEAEIYFLSAMLCWIEGSDALAREAVRSLLALDPIRKTQAESSASDLYPFSLSYWRGRTLELKSKNLDRVDFAEAASLMIAAFAEFDDGEVRDRYAEAAMLVNAVFLARDSGNSVISQVVRERAARFEWSDSLRFFEFHAFNGLGTRFAYEGDHVSALRSFRRSAEAAPSVPLRLRAILDRCRLIQDLGEVTTATEELDYASTLAAQVDWSAVVVQERDALSALAQSLAPFDIKRARAFHDRFRSTTAPMRTIVVPNETRGRRAEECTSEARILRFEGETKRATSLLLEAFATYTELADQRRLALVACELAELTGERRYVDVAASEARRYPESILARRLERVLAAEARPSQDYASAVG